MTRLRGTRILMTADAVGGVWTYALDLARGLSTEGCEVVLALLGPPPSPAERAITTLIPGLRILETGLPPDWLAPGPEAVIGAGHALSRLARGVGADLVHLNNPALAAGGAFGCPVLAVAHSCLRTWWGAVRGDAPLPPAFARQAELTGRGYAAAQAVVAPSGAFAAATAAAYRLASLPAVVHNGRVSPQAAPHPGVSAPPFVFTAGRLWDDGKNIRLLDEIAPRLPCPVLAAGPTVGPNGAAIALDRVRSLGRLDPDGVSRHLSERPIYAAPALYEPFGLAVLEAAQHGCPLVLSDIPVFRELWDGAALFASPRDVGGFAGAIEALAADPPRAAGLGVAARERAGRFTAAAMAAGTAAIYRRILGRDAAPVRLAS